MFKIVGWMHPDTFYLKYMKDEEEENLKNEVIVVEDTDEQLEKKNPGDEGEFVEIDDIKVDMREKHESGTSGGPPEDHDKSVIAAMYTMDDLVKQHTTARGNRSHRYKEA